MIACQRRKLEDGSLWQYNKLKFILPAYTTHNDYFGSWLYKPSDFHPSPDYDWRYDTPTHFHLGLLGYKSEEFKPPLVNYQDEYTSTSTNNQSEHKPKDEVGHQEINTPAVSDIEIVSNYSNTEDGHQGTSTSLVSDTGILSEDDEWTRSVRKECSVRDCSWWQ